MPGSAPPLLLLVTAALLPLIGVAGGCVPEQLVQGCRLEEGACVCGLGCNTTFRYATRDQCQAALKERQQRDQCQSSPCQHGGVCSQTSREPGYQCLCANTGYYGRTCHKRCPTVEEFTKLAPESRYPIECMII